MQSISEISGGTEWAQDPSLYLQTVGAFKEEIEKGRAALETSGADQITFFWVGAPDVDGFLEPISPYDETKDLPEVCTYVYNEGEKPTPHCFAPDDYYEVRWQGPHLKVTNHDAILQWDAKHGNEELWVTINEEDENATI